MKKKKSPAKKARRKKALMNKGVKINSKTGRHSFANTPLAKALKKHNLGMMHGYETQLLIYNTKTGKPVK